MRQEKKRKWDSLSSGEALFGLLITAHPELQQTADELAMLSRLYSLYKTVIDSIHGYGDYLWSDVVAQVGAHALCKLQIRCRFPDSATTWRVF